MKINKEKFLTIIAISTLLIGSFMATFAYFSSLGDITATSDVSVLVLSRDQTVTTSTDVSLDIYSDDMKEATGSNNYTSFKDADNPSEVKIQTTLGSGGGISLCTYDLIYIPNPGYTAAANNTTGLKEFVILLNSVENNAKRLGNYPAEYDLTNVTSTVTLAQNQKIAVGDGIDQGNVTWEITPRYYNLEIDQSDKIGISFGGRVEVTNINCMQVEEMPLGEFPDSILAKNSGGKAIRARALPNYNDTATSHEGMFAIPDDYGTSYFFRGAVDNNWVKFAGYYWRIIRINGDGSVRMIYTGSTAPTSGEAVVMTGSHTQVGTSAFSPATQPYEMAGYTREVGVFRGHAEESIIKVYLEDWYEDNLLEYDDYITDSIFCSDRRATSNKSDPIRYEVEPIGMPTQIFTSWFSFPDARMHTTIEPLTLACFHKEDAYTKDDNVLGNTQLNHKVGLIGVDEAKISGLKYQSNNTSHYLHTGSEYWFLTISYAGATLKKTNNHVMRSTGQMYYTDIVVASGVRPVISVRTEVILSGTGTWNDPYIVE